MGKCEICNKKEHERNLIFSIAKKYRDYFFIICLQCEKKELKKEQIK